LLPDDLVNACKAGECVLYAGSGLSAQAGLQTYLPMVSELLGWAMDNGFVDPSFAQSLQEALQQGDTDLVADSIVSVLGNDRRDALASYLKDTFLHRPPSLPEAHALLREIPFGAVLSTNFDDLLEWTFEQVDQTVQPYTPLDAERLLAALTKRDFFLLKLYGTLELPETVLIAPAQYQEVVAGNLGFSRFMESLFHSRTLLFLGASLEGILAYLQGLKFGQISSRPHYALVDVTGSAWKAKADLLKRRYGIEVLPYTASPGFPEFTGFIARLREATRPQDQGGAPESSPGASDERPVRLQRILLQNIGPFEHQTFDLGHPWTLLLGDNGVGKSSILRAIAIGLCGDAAKSYAARLLRRRDTGDPVSQGTITLEILSEVNGTPVVKTYTTSILLGEDGQGAEMRTVPTVPLEAEGWLALGFPPLRLLSWQRDTDPPPSGRERPVPADLMPLIAGELDPRLDKLKNWLFDLDHQILGERSKGLTETLNMKLMADFFKVIGEVTPGLRLELVDIDIQKREVRVRTDDGIVPIESVSQGTASLIGWIGVLLRRLYNLYGDQPEPRERYALVLIDEIDAHMHPEWQRLLVTRLRALFPKLQIVASTHSPLIVPSLESEEIIRLARDPKTGQIRAGAPAYDVKVYRSDQILTSPLFGLGSSLSPIMEKQVREYTRLAATDHLTPEDRKRLEELAFELNMKAPSPAERAEARLAYNWIHAAMEERMSQLSPDLKERVNDEMKVQLEELVTGSRRP
jgi:hypothetical protein